MTLPFSTASARPVGSARRFFIGGSDARIIMGDDEAALVRLWREKRGEAEPPDYSDNLIVQLGLATEPLNRRWYEKIRAGDQAATSPPALTQAKEVSHGSG